MKQISVFFAVAIAVVLVTVACIRPATTALAGGYNGTNPHTTGCDQHAFSRWVKFYPNTLVELRKSTSCNTFWARTTNRNWAYRLYANATLHYPRYVTYSPGPIWPDDSVYTLQHDIDGEYFTACGIVTDHVVTGAVTYPCAVSATN